MRTKFTYFFFFMYSYFKSIISMLIIGNVGILNFNIFQGRGGEAKIEGMVVGGDVQFYLLFEISNGFYVSFKFCQMFFYEVRLD